MRERLLAANLTHGHTVKGSSPTYRVWRNMINRCTDSSNKQYDDYGGRGITVCDAWLNSFEQFLADVGERPQGMTLDRIDNSKGYLAGNVRWTTQKQQCRNTRRNKFYTFNGETKCLAEWSENLGINYFVLRARIEMKWTIERAFTEPVKVLCKHSRA